MGAVFNNDGLALQFAPEDVMTEIMCYVSVSDDGYALGIVPDKFRTPLVVDTAMEQLTSAV